MKKFIKKINKILIKRWLIRNNYINGSYKINDDLTIDIDGLVGVHNNVIKFPYKFNIINGNFDCSQCKNLKSLYNSPNIVKGYFNCSGLNIDSYEGGPKEIDGILFCYGTNIESIRPWLDQIKMNSNAKIYDNKYSFKGIKYKDYIKEKI